MSTRSLQPTFTIIIPTHNRPEGLALCLESLCTVEYSPSLWSVIVVNDGSTKPYDEMIERYSLRLSLLYIVSEPAGPAHARNLGAGMATSDYIAFLDDDCTVEADWLRAYARGFQSTDDDALGGQTLPASPGRIGSTAWHHLVSFLYFHWKDQSGNTLILISNNSVYKRTVFQALGGFDLQFKRAASEDRDLSWRLLLNEYKQAFLSTARVQHSQTALGFWGYLRLQFRYGIGSYQFHRKSSASKDQILGRFYKYPRAAYLRSLYHYLVQNQVTLLVALLIVLGHISHRLGQTFEMLASLVARDSSANP